MDEVEKEISHFIVEKVLGGRNSIGLRDSLSARGLLDSIEYIRLFAFIERTYGVALIGEVTSPGQIDSIESIAKLVRSRRRFQ